MIGRRTGIRDSAQLRGETGYKSVPLAGAMSRRALEHRGDQPLSLSAQPARVPPAPAPHLPPSPLACISPPVGLCDSRMVCRCAVLGGRPSSPVLKGTAADNSLTPLVVSSLLFPPSPPPGPLAAYAGSCRCHCEEAGSRECRRRHCQACTSHSAVLCAHHSASAATPQPPPPLRTAHCPRFRVVSTPIPPPPRVYNRHLSPGQPAFLPARSVSLVWVAAVHTGCGAARRRRGA